MRGFTKTFVAAISGVASLTLLGYTANNNPPSTG